MTVIGVNDAPVIPGPSANILISSAIFAFIGANTISVSDSDISSGLATVTLMVNDPGGILQLGNLTGLNAVSGNGTSNVLSFTRTVADVNNALASLAYSPDDVNGAATLTVVVSDNGNSGVDPSTIGLPHTGTTTDEQATRVFNLTVSDINDAPVNTVPGAQTFNEDTPRVFSTANGNAISIADVDAFGFDVSTTITVNSGTLTAGGTALQQAALTSLTGNGSNTLVLTGTVAEINDVLQGLSYIGNLNSHGTDITDDAVDTNEDNAVVLNVITGTNGATPDTFEGMPVLTAINGTSVTVGSIVDVGDGTITVDATTGLLTFTPDADFNGDVTFTYTVTGPAGVTETATVTVRVAPVNDAPVAVGFIADRNDNDSDAVNVDVSGFFDDIDAGDVLSYSASILPAGVVSIPSRESLPARSLPWHRPPVPATLSSRRRMAMAGW